MMDQSSALLASQTAPILPRQGESVAAARKAGENFESFFLSQTFESMFSGVGQDDLFGGGEGEKIYRSMLLQEYSKVAARSGGVGIASAVQREILQAQEAH
jgi:Rod binding domain-containing protein